MIAKPIVSAVLPDWAWPECDDEEEDLEGCGYCRFLASTAWSVPEWGHG